MYVCMFFSGWVHGSHEILALERCGCNPKLVIFKLISRILNWVFSVKFCSGECHKPMILQIAEYMLTKLYDVVGCYYPDSMVNGDNMGPTWVLSAPDGSHVAPMKLAIWEGYHELQCVWLISLWCQLIWVCHDTPRLYTKSYPWCRGQCFLQHWLD